MTLLDYMAAAAVLGVSDGLNPYMLAMVLCLLVFWARVGTTARRIALTGKFTAGTVLLLTFFLGWGENAFLLEHPAVNHIIYFLSLGLAAILLVVGYVLFRHWRRGKTQVSSPWLPLFLVEDIKAVEKNTGIIFFSIILGLATVSLVSLWPKGQNLYIVYYVLFSRGNALLAVLFFALYGLALTAPLLAVWGAIFYIKRSTKLRNDFLGAISWLRICFSALFIAVGLGLVYLFILT